jgi:hypothetical protein
MNNNSRIFGIIGAALVVLITLIGTEGYAAPARKATIIPPSKITIQQPKYNITSHQCVAGYNMVEGLCDGPENQEKTFGCDFVGQPSFQSEACSPISQLLILMQHSDVFYICTYKMDKAKYDSINPTTDFKCANGFDLIDTSASSPNCGSGTIVECARNYSCAKLSEYNCPDTNPDSAYSCGVRRNACGPNTHQTGTGVRWTTSERTLRSHCCQEN